MTNIVIMKILFVIIMVANLGIPYYKDWSWHFSIFQMLIVIFWFFGLLGGLGYFEQATPIVQIGITRIVQCGSYLLFKIKIVNWITIGIFILLDIVFLLFLLFDKANYSYEVVEEDNNGSEKYEQL